MFFSICNAIPNLVFACDAGVSQYTRTDEVKLRQVLVNLLSNAFKFTQEGKVELLPDTCSLRLRDVGDLIHLKAQRL